MDDLFKLLGLGGPFIAAAACYTLFKFLDSKASVAANDAVVSWIKGESYKKLDLGAAVISGFNHLYGAQLLRVTAFLLFAAFSLCAIIILSFFALGPWHSGAIGIFLLIGPPIIISDYLSLFIAKRCLILSARNLRQAIFLATMTGLIAVTIVSSTVWWVFSFTIDPIYREFNVRPPSLMARIAGDLAVSAPAFLVHLWLPLFLLGAALNRGLNSFFRAVGFAQWFIDRGESHPFDAIGITLSVLVFAATSLVQIIRYVL